MVDGAAEEKRGISTRSYHFIDRLLNTSENRRDAISDLMGHVSYFRNRHFTSSLEASIQLSQRLALGSAQTKYFSRKCKGTGFIGVVVWM